MAKDYPSLSTHHRDWIGRQRIFFTATAAAGTRVNVSPRATDWFRVIGENAALYLDRTGSGNETAAHTLAGGPMTIMFCAFEGQPLILRLYGQGRAVRHGSEEYAALLTAHFGGSEPTGARQIMRLDFDLVKSSCGYGVPFFDYREERDQMDRWCAAKGEDGLVAYRAEKNAVSIDGLPTGYVVEPAE